MNKRNYQKELDAIINNIVLTAGEKDGGSDNVPSLLLHSCCAPCSSYCIEYLSHYFRITLLYYNPNISPKEEYDTRVRELHRLVKEMTEKGVFEYPVSVVDGRYEPEVFEDMSRGLEEVPEGGNRCYKCYEMRLSEAVKYAAQKGYDYFTTTLSISPMKNAQWLNEIGERLAGEYKVAHLPSEFKKKGGYLRSVELSREYDLYRQDFCGCVYSRRAAEKRRELTGTNRSKDQLKVL